MAMDTMMKKKNLRKKDSESNSIERIYKKIL